MSKTTIFTIIFLAIFTSGTVKAQVYSPTGGSPLGLGVRISPDGIGAKALFLMNHWAVEAQLNASQGYFWGPGNTPGYGPSFTAVGLLEYQAYFPNPHWRLYVGPGVHAGVADRHPGWPESRRYQEFIFGMDGVVGLEYVFKRVPIGISADMKPAVNFGPKVEFFPGNFVGISGTYYLGRSILPPTARR